MTNIVFESRNVNASRLVFGLANIGYKPYAAIEDIIDNSVSANATKIKVIIDVEDGLTLTEKNNIKRVIIVDNGDGMDDDKIRAALDIGSDVSYAKNSLSKYGFGLKSAGLSLGNNISVISKNIKGKLTNELCLDVGVIEDKGEYGVLIRDSKDNGKLFLSNFDTGTAVIISNIQSSVTANSLKNKLLSRLGVIYYDFLSKNDNELKIDIIVRDKVHSVEPIDILFRNDSADSFEEYDYDCKTPCKVVTDETMRLGGSDDSVSPIVINVTIFPQDQMKKYAGFSEDERSKIKGYLVSEANSGFFIFRNNRLIRWGDNLGIITRDDRTFRGRIDITSEHDELLNVDVSKQNLTMPEDFLDELSLICRIPRDYASKAAKRCASMIDNNDNKEGEQSSESVIDIVEEDPITQVEPTDQETKSERRKSIILDNIPTVDTDNVDVVDVEVSSIESDKFSKIRYLDYLHSPNLWQADLDPEYGTVVYINKSHQFYRLVLKNLKSADPKRQALECFIYCVAVGENKTKENLSSVDFDDIKKTLDRFESVASWNLQNWTSHNQDLFD